MGLARAAEGGGEGMVVDDVVLLEVCVGDGDLGMFFFLLEDHERFWLCVFFGWCFPLFRPTVMFLVEHSGRGLPTLSGTC